MKWLSTLKRKAERLSSSVPGEATDGQIRGFLIKRGVKDTEVEVNAHTAASTALQRWRRRHRFLKRPGWTWTPLRSAMYQDQRRRISLNVSVAEAGSRGSTRICSQNKSSINLHSRKEPSTAPTALSSPLWGSTLVFERLLTFNSNFKVTFAYMLSVWVANSSSNKWSNKFLHLEML